MLKKISRTKIQLNSLGEAKFTNSATGEICAVKVEIGNSGPETKIEILTSEGEKIIYSPVDRSFIDYPIHVGNPVYHSFSGGEKADNLIPHLNYGSLVVTVLGDPESEVKRITIFIKS